MIGPGFPPVPGDHHGCLIESLSPHNETVLIIQKVHPIPTYPGWGVDPTDPVHRDAGLPAARQKDARQDPEQYSNKVFGHGDQEEQ